MDSINIEINQILDHAFSVDIKGIFINKKIIGHEYAKQFFDHEANALLGMTPIKIKDEDRKKLCDIINNLKSIVNLEPNVNESFISFVTRAVTAKQENELAEINKLKAQLFGQNKTDDADNVTNTENNTATIKAEDTANTKDTSDTTNTSAADKVEGSPNTENIYNEALEEVKPANNQASQELISAIDEEFIRLVSNTLGEKLIDLNKYSADPINWMRQLAIMIPNYQDLLNQAKDTVLKQRSSPVL